MDPLLLQLLDGKWQTQAECSRTHPEANWFPTQGQAHTQATRNAINICHTCPVEQECLSYSLITENHRDRGIWGGLTHKERVAMRASLYTTGDLQIIRTCANPACARTFTVKSRHVPKTGVCCSHACRLARRRRLRKAAWA